ncbi:phosphoglycerate kinase [Patescibacteria group bacterium]|nr:phosphoglycerate kinase [Patescibacteria group bacterium]
MGERKLVTMDDLPLDGRRVLLRVDFNISFGDDGEVDAFEDFRIKATLPTIEELIQRRCKIIILPRRGRPEENPEEADLTPIHKRLEQLLHETVVQTKHFSGSPVEAVVAGLSAGGIVMLPNVRIDERELSLSEQFAKELASVADMYINEAFSGSHRRRTSLEIIPKFLPACAGRRTELEITQLDKLKNNPARPYVAIVSGGKIATKVKLLESLLLVVDTLYVAGEIGNVLLAAQGDVSTAGFTEAELADAQRVLALKSKKLVLPVDVVIGSEDGEQGVETLLTSAIPPDVTRLWDIGAASIDQLVAGAAQAQTVLWNGPVGRFEIPAYAVGTRELAIQLAALDNHRVVGGGDTVIALEQAQVRAKFNHVSIGGGAMLDYLEGRDLPGLKPLYAQD